MIRAGRTIRIAFVAGALAASTYAQGGDGRSDSAVVRSAKSDSTRSVRAAKPHRRLPSPSPVIRKAEPARLAITINEGGSTVDLDRIGAEGQAELISVPSRSASLIVRSLPAGTYTISAKKPGYHDVAQTIDLAEGKRRRVNIVLKPKMAILSVSSNVPDAGFSIDRLGEFDRPLKKHFVTPGTYRVTVSRRGYESRTIPINLKRAGQEENLNVVLRPLSTDAVLRLAEQEIGRGRLAEAAAMIDDVLQVNDTHARANLLRGMVELKRGSEKAIAHFIKAIDRGETLRLPMILTNASSGKANAVTFTLDRGFVGVESPSIKDSNVRIRRGSVTEVDRSRDPAFISVKGNSDFHGRPIQPNLRLNCSGSTPADACRTEMEIVFKLLTAWRRSADAGVANYDPHRRERKPIVFRRTLC